MNDQQATEYYAYLESAMQAARWAIPVDLAVIATDHVLQHPGALPFDGLAISGDHRPREHDDGFTDERVIPCLICGAEIRLAFGPDLERRRAASIARHVERDPRHARRER